MNNNLQLTTERLTIRSFTRSDGAQAVLKSAHPLATILAITKPNNVSSNKLLVKLGFQAQCQLEIYGEQNNLCHYQAPAP